MVTAIGRLAHLKRWNLLLTAIACLALPVLTYAIGGSLLANAWLRLGLWALSALIGGVCLSAWSRRDGRGWGLWMCMALATGLIGCLHIAFSYRGDITDYPLTLGWSETSRYYYASLFFSRQIYGVDAPPTVLHPSRYLLQAAPFLLPGAGLLAHRAWQVFLWLAAPAIFAALLTRRVIGWSRPEVGRPRMLRTALSAAIFLLLMTGPVYYHLLPAAMLVVGWFRPPVAGCGWRGWIRPALIVAAASAWAGISRVNWFPVPGLLAAALILLESPPSGLLLGRGITSQGRQEWRDLLAYILRLGGWVVGGGLAAMGAQALYILWSGNAAEQFTTSFASDLLWSRLLPNSTYPLGILPATVLVSLPVALIFLARLAGSSDRQGTVRCHPLTQSGLAAILGVLFLGGLVVSIKIGGGSNLHNMDAFLVLLVVVGIYFERLPGEPSTGWARKALVAGRILALVIPAAFAIGERGPAGALLDRSAAQAGVQTIVEAAEFTAHAGGEVLFLSNRHLLTFGQIQGVQLVPEYERVFLMEAAMARDPQMLGQLEQDLRLQRFALIVSEPLSKQLKGAGEDFGAENDVWVQGVTRPILCYYEPVKTLRPVQVQLLAPRSTPDAGCK